MEGKKKMKLPVKVIIVGCILGLLVAAVGVYKQMNAKNINEERKAAALKASEEAVAAANARLEEIATEYNMLKSQYDAKVNECAEINKNKQAADWYAKSTKCISEESDIKSKMNNLEIEETAIKNKDYTGYYQEVKPMSYQIFYIIGASIAGAALLGAFIIYLVKGKKTY